MKKTSTFIQRHLATLTFVALYAVIFINHLVVDGFDRNIQIEMLLVVLPFLLVAVILDYILAYDSGLHEAFRVVAQILPFSLIALIILSGFLTLTSNNSSSLSDVLDYTYMLFIAVPFFMASYNKENKKALIFSILGTVFFAAVYIYLTTGTYKLATGGQAFIYFLAYFFILYSASIIKRLPFMGLIIGGLAGIALLIMRFKPGSMSMFSYTWDMDIAINFEKLTLVIFIVCILIRFTGAIVNKRQNVSKITHR